MTATPDPDFDEAPEVFNRVEVGDCAGQVIRNRPASRQNLGVNFEVSYAALTSIQHHISPLLYHFLKKGRPSGSSTSLM